MTKARTMLSLAADYLSERRALGFDLRIAGNQIVAFPGSSTTAATTARSPTRSS